MSGSGWESFPDVPEWSGGPSRCLGVVRRPSRISGSCLESLLDGREWWEAITNIREWSGGPTRCPGVVRRPSRMSGSGCEALLDVLEW